MVVVGDVVVVTRCRSGGSVVGAVRLGGGSSTVVDGRSRRVVVVERSRGGSVDVGAGRTSTLSLESRVVVVGRSAGRRGTVVVASTITPTPPSRAPLSAGDVDVVEDVRSDAERSTSPMSVTAYRPGPYVTPSSSIDPSTSIVEP